MDSETHCIKCKSEFAPGDLSIQCEGCLDHYHRQCTQLTKAAYDAIGKVKNIHWFCDVCDGKIMGLVSRLPSFVEKREKEAELLTKTNHDLANITKELKGLDIKKKIELFEGVTTCIGPKIQHLQDTIQKIDTKITNMSSSNTWSSVVSNGIQAQTSITKSQWNPEASVVITGIKNFKETHNSSTIKTELSKQYKQTKFKSVMKRANGNIIVETESKEAAENMINRWHGDLFGGSQCRSTRKRSHNTVVLKDVPLPLDIEKTGITETELSVCIQQKFPGAKVQRFKRQDGTPMHLVKVDTETEQQAAELLQNGINLGSLWVQAEDLKPRSPKIVQCYKCLRLGHISLQCRSVQKCSRCSEEGHSYKECANSSIIKCANCNGNHIAISHECNVIKKKMNELSERQNNHGR